MTFINVCLSTHTGNPPVTNPSSTCPKCGVTKSGKRSCCSRGGTWYRNCGDVGNSKFEHTWSEGIQVCEGFVASVQSADQAQVMLSHVTSNPHAHLNVTKQAQENTVRVENVPGHESIESLGADDVFNVGTSDFKDCFKLSEIISFIGTSIVILHM